MRRTGSPGQQQTSGAGWDLVHKAPDQPATSEEAATAQKAAAKEDPTVAAMREERTRLLRKIQDNRRLVKRFTSQLHDTETFIKVSLYVSGIKHSFFCRKKSSFNVFLWVRNFLECPESCDTPAISFPGNFIFQFFLFV